MAVVELQKLTKMFNQVKVVSEIDLIVGDGEFVTLLGPSGCGKTTTLNMIAGVEDPTSGKILMNGHVVNDRSPIERDIAMVFQNYALYPHMTVSDNIGFTLRLRKLSASEIARRTGKVADILEIGHLLKRYPGQLSGGQQQRVAIGRAIVREPKLFLLDEPFSNLDAALRMRLRAEVKFLHQRLMTTSVFVTHDQEEALSLSDRIAIMRQGQVEQYGSPEDVYVRPISAYVAQFIGMPRLELLEGNLENAGGEPVFRMGENALRVPPGVAVHVAEAGPVRLGIRPEHIVLSDRGCQATVSLVQPMGSSSCVSVSWQGGALTARVPGMSSITLGSRIFFDAAAPNLMFFSSQTGRRIETPI